MHRRSLLPLLALLLVAGQTHAGNWPRFRGPNGTGIAPEDIPTEWTAENTLWKVPLPGIGHSSPIIWGDRLFLQSASADGKHRWLLCLDADKGTVLWRKEVEGADAHTNRLNNLASSTPATDGERVYAIFWDGKDLALHAYTVGGDKVWERDLGPFKSQHGAGLSPMVFKDTVYIHHTQIDAAALVAVNAKTGEVRWRKERKPFKTCYPVPFLHETDAGPEVIIGSTAGLAGYDPETGKENWIFHWKWEGRELRTVGSPVAAGGLIFLSSGNGGGSRNMIAVRTGGKGDVSSTHLGWSSSERGLMPYVPGFLAHNGYLYCAQDKTGVVSCLKVQDGEPLWSQRVNSAIWASPVLAGNKLVVVTEKGDAYVFEAGPTKKLLAKNALGEDVSATPAIANGRIYVRTKEHLFCIGKR